MMNVFECFNADVLKGIKPVEYYNIFNEDYPKINEIISIRQFS